MQQKAIEKIDPLTRIQEEIKEVVRREQEYRQLTTALAGTTPTATPTPPPIQVAFEGFENGNGSGKGHGVLVTAQPAAVESTATEEHSPSNTPSLASSVNSNKEESLDEHHSDDSGISASSLSLKGNSSKVPQLKLNIMRQEQRYIGPNCYNLTPEPPQQKLMTRTISTPQLHGQQQRRQFAFNSSTKGVMQRFIASHGKLQLGPGPNHSPVDSPTLKLNTRNALAFLETGGSGGGGSGVGATAATLTPPAAIERDSEGRPLRRGYVPVEQKIQRELQDLKSRETELKRLRKLNRQALDKLQLSTDDEADAEADADAGADADDDDDDSEVEHCYGPGKLRNAQSTMELDSNDLDHGYKANGNGSVSALAAGLRPAMSLAQLCDLTPEEAPSSHRLIAQWESLIKKNAEGATLELAI